MASTKKFTPNKFKTNRQQHQPRPILKNVDPFSHRQQGTNSPIRGGHSQRTNYPAHKGGFQRTNSPIRKSWPRRLDRKQLFRCRQQLLRPLRRLLRRIGKHPRKFRRKLKKLRLRKARPYTPRTKHERKERSLSYLARRRNRYWRKTPRPLHRGQLRTSIAYLSHSVHTSTRAHAAARPYKASLRLAARRAIIRAFRPATTKKIVLTEEAILAKGVARRRRLWRYRLKRRGLIRTPSATAKVTCASRSVNLRLQHSRHSKVNLSLNIRCLAKLFIKTKTRLKRHKRGRISKRPSLPKKGKQLVLARQLVRKLRAVQRTATRVLRRRLLRYKRRYFRKPRTRFNVIRYTRRLRVKRRFVRRVRRYIRSTATIFRGARTRILRRRSVSRERRVAYVQLSQRSRLLLLNPFQKGIKHTKRQQLFILKEQRRRLRSLRLLRHQGANLTQKIARPNAVFARRAAAQLRRRLVGYTSNLALRLPRPRAELTPDTFAITSTWLLRRQQRARRRSLNQPYLITELSQLKQYRTARTALAPVFHELSKGTLNKNWATNRGFLKSYRQKKKQHLCRHVSHLAHLQPASVKARMAAFRASAIRMSLLTQSATQTFRAATLTVRSERTRLIEARYYRTRAKLRLPNQGVKGPERKRQGLRLFARHTLKRPKTVIGRGNLLLPVANAYKVSSWQPLTIQGIFDKDVAVPKRLRAYHPRVHFRGPRRYELGIILANRTRKSIKKRHRHVRFVRIASRKRKAALKKSRTSTIKSAPQPNFETLTAVIQKAKEMNSAILTQQFFKNLNFYSPTQQAAAKALFLSRLQAAHLKLSATKRRVTKIPRLAHRTTGVARLTLKATRLTNEKTRELSLWHVRSVQGMLNRERDLSAWSPQYGTAFRRWSSPRRYGRPMQTRKLSRLARKLRRVINNALASNNRPKRKHFDRSFGRLQYYMGSAASLGYARYRRVYRPKSKNNRWWKPLTQAVPFTHPYSRRSLNAKKNVRVNLDRKLGYRCGGATGRTRRTGFRWFEPEEKPRSVLSRTFKFNRRYYQTKRAFLQRVRSERAKMPFTLQRWLPVKLKSAGKVNATAYANTVLARTRRSIRKLERTFPKSNAWASHRWAALDRRTSITAPTALFTAAANKLSSSFWNRLRALAGTQSNRAALQKTLFIRFRSWQLSTTGTPVAGGLNYSQHIALAAKFIVTTVGELLHGVTDANLYSNLINGAFIRRLTKKQYRSWNLRQANKRRKAIKTRSTSIYKKSNHPLRRRWLQGAERYLKRSRVGRLPPRHRRGGDHRMTNYGRSRRRFPASGRRKQSYDSMLHAFTKRVSPPRFRRAAVTRFRCIQPKTVRDSKVNRSTYELTRRRRLQRRIAHTLSRIAYLSPTWRELLTFREHSPIVLPTNDYTASAEEALLATDGSTVKSLTPYNAEYGQPFSMPTKRRFASLPANVIFKREELARRLLRSNEVLSLRAHRIGLLRTALRRRRMERVYVDLKKHTSRRRLSKEQLAPSWKRRKLARKREKYLRYGDWTPRHFWLRPAKNISWTLHSLEERAPRRQDRALDISLRSPSDELFLLTPKTAKRRNWAKRGFRIQLTSPRVKARRSRQVIRRRRRRSRRRGLGGWVKFHHWSERKNYGKILDRSRKFKRASGRLLARQNRRSRTGLLFSSRRKVRMMFVKRIVTAVEASLPSRLTFQTTTLSRFSSLERRRGLKRLQRRAAHRRSKFLRRQVAALSRQYHPTQGSSKDIVSARQFAVRALKPFTENLTPRTPLAPLTFVHRTRRVIKTEAEKRRAVIWNIKNKELRYKKTAQYTESLTRFIPELMSYMLSRHVSRKKLTYSYVKGLISATYWNLRIYLNVDPFSGRLGLRDRNFKRLRFLTKAIAKLAKEQVTEHADRMRLRWRFQPCKLQPAPTSDRFRLDWLRMFFPRKHALYQEDPEYYSGATVSSRNIRRVPLTGYGVGRARTYRSTISVERRARHLLRMRLSRRDPRLETVLQTTRRVPETELEQFVPVIAPDSEEVVLEKERVLAQRIAEADAAIFARSKKFVFVKKVRAPKLTSAEAASAELDRQFEEHTTSRNPLFKERIPFFQRAYSTATSRALISTAKLIAQQGRLAATEDEQSTAFSELSARARVKARLVARGRTNFVASTDFMVNAGGLDPRFLRYKSPRSRQYEIRKSPLTTTKNSTDKQFTELARFHQKRESLWPHQETTQLLRLRRHHFYVDTPVVEKTRTAQVLTKMRTTNPSRRIPTVLQARAAIARRQALRAELYNFPNRKQFTFTSPDEHASNALLRKRGRTFELRPLLKGQLSQHWRARLGTTGVVVGERAALLYRTPTKRSVTEFYRADRVLSYRPVQSHRGVIARGKSGKRVYRILGRVQRHYKKSLRAVPFALSGTKVSQEHKPKRIAVALIGLQQATRRTAGGFKSSRWAGLTSRKRIALSRSEISFHPSLYSTQNSKVTYFRTTALHRIARLSRFTRRCIVRQRVDYQTPFDTYRPQLWHMLTHRWMKKHRILKEWLKEVNHWFRDPWLSLLVDPVRRSKRVPGDIRAREQQDGEIVTGKENTGYTGAEKATRVKAAKRAIVGALTVVKKDIEHTKRQTARASTAQKSQILLRVKRSRQALRKPRPSMWLANLQCKRWVAEKAAWLTKSRAEQRAHRLELKNISIARVKSGKRPLAPKAAPLKLPANHFIAHKIWKDIHRRVRRLTWRESDDAFTRRGFRNAFKFYPTERNRAPWLEALMYNRSLYSTNLREFRRRQFPREQKKYKWLQRVRKSLFAGRTHTYIKGRRWPRIRMYNQRLHYSLFSLPDRNAARRHFKKLRGRSRTIGFVHAQGGLSNRLDNVLIHLNMAPTIFWARHVATRGLLRVNGKIAYGADYRLKAGDFIEPVWDKVIKYRHFFKNPMHRREEKFRHHRWSPTGVSRNFEYHPTIRCYTFLGNPREEDLRESSRLQPHLFRWFCLDSGAKKSVT